jgi:preprotein translocase subunit SecF
MRLKLVPSITNVDFFKYYAVTFGISAVAVLASLILYVAVGLNQGVDFRGGTMITAETQGAADVGAFREVLGGLDLGDVSVTEIRDPAAEVTGTARNAVLIRVEQEEGVDAIGSEAVAAIKTALDAAFPGIIYLATDSVGAKVSGELLRSGAIAVVLSVLAILFYVWLRFEWQFSVGAVAALVHDVLLTLGVFVLFRLEFNLSILAAILTIVGYSLNDTVVIFDRVRENLRKYKTKPLVEVLNISVNETLSRTIMTAMTVLIALLALLFFGGEVLRGFTFAMIWGVFVGTYSTVFVATVVVLWLGVKRDWSKPDGAAGTQFAGIEA